MIKHVILPAAAAVFGYLIAVALAVAGPRPCEIQAHDPRLLADAPAPRAAAGKPRLVPAKAVAVGHYAQTGQDAVGVVVGYGDAPADALDRTGTVQLLILDPGRAGNAAGETVTLGGMELVIDLGLVPLPG